MTPASEAPCWVVGSTCIAQHVCGHGGTEKDRATLRLATGAWVPGVWVEETGGGG
jgi:hypothetical protein